MPDEVRLEKLSLDAVTYGIASVRVHLTHGFSSEVFEMPDFKPSKYGKILELDVAGNPVRIVQGIDSG